MKKLLKKSARSVGSVGSVLFFVASLAAAEPPADYSQRFQDLAAQRTVSDSERLHRLFDLAWEKGYQLVTPLPKGQPGHQYQSPHRLRSIALMKSKFGIYLYSRRIAIEQAYGNATSFAGGLAPLPAWVRGLDRVRTWLWAKLLINAVRILKNKDLRRD